MFSLPCSRAASNRSSTLRCPLILSGSFFMLTTNFQWTKSGPLQTRLSLPDLNPGTTIFYMQTILTQTYTLQSPRDPPTSIPLTYKADYPVGELGKKPPAAHEHLNEGLQSLWRGVDAGGREIGEFKADVIARIPVTALIRPSTLPG